MRPCLKKQERKEGIVGGEEGGREGRKREGGKREGGSSQCRVAAPTPPQGWEAEGHKLAGVWESRYTGEVVTTQLQLSTHSSPPPGMPPGETVKHEYMKHARKYLWQHSTKEKLTAAHISTNKKIKH